VLRVSNKNRIYGDSVMNKLCLWGAVCAALVFTSPNLNAATVVTGTVAGPGEWGLVQFGHSGGDLIVDILAAGWTGGATGLGIEDTLITLYTDDGSPLTAFTGSLVALNDDYLPWAGIDGSTSVSDSLLELIGLGAGDYLLAIGNCCGAFTGDSSVSSGIQAPYLDYQVTFSRDVVVSGVPVPAAAWLFGSGLLGLIGFARRKKA